MNKELDKQNLILLSDRYDRFYQSQAQIFQAINTPGMPPELKQYYLDTLLATRATGLALSRAFNIDNVDTVLPDVSHIIEAAIKAAASGAGAGNGNQNSGRPNPVSSVPTASMGTGGVPSGTGTPI